MADIRFSNAANTYRDALRAAEQIINKASSSTSPVEETTEARASAFLDMIGNALQGAEQAGLRSESVSAQAIAGKANLSDVITAVSSAENALQTVVAVRDKVISAYQDIIRMPI